MQIPFVFQSANITSLEQLKAEEKSNLEKQLKETKTSLGNKEKQLMKAQQEWDKVPIYIYIVGHTILYMMKIYLDFISANLVILLMIDISE